MGQVLFHKRVEKDTKIRSLKHVFNDEDSRVLISQGWELFHIEHDSGCMWNHYMLIWTKEVDPPVFKTEYEKREEERKATKEAERLLLEREKRLVELLISLIPKETPIQKVWEAITELEVKAEYASDKGLYPYAQELLSSF